MICDLKPDLIIDIKHPIKLLIDRAWFRLLCTFITPCCKIARFTGD